MEYNEKLKISLTLQKNENAKLGELSSLRICGGKWPSIDLQILAAALSVESQCIITPSNKISFTVDALNRIFLLLNKCGRA